ncbi:MAG: hypothetical protein JWO35_547 [Candidatus Saccharibacteria bacterium]|nr:hypothetical protein [Candidatus Saccharibacteria bacterium]
MNPSSNETGLNLPPPIPEQAPPSAGAPEAAVPKVEQAPIAAERAPTAAQVAPPLNVPMPVPMPANGQQDDVSVTTQGVVQTLPDDGDLIEKEWVNKAKAIVARTRDDPYTQSEELTVFKADYMKKRYDKTIKVSK